MDACLEPSRSGRGRRSDVGCRSMVAAINLYRKRPVTVVVSDPITVSNRDEIRAWCNGREATGEYALTVPTLEGDHLASFGDRVICGVGGEFYPIKPGIFEATYEPVFVEA